MLTSRLHHPPTLSTCPCPLPTKHDGHTRSKTDSESLRPFPPRVTTAAHHNPPTSRLLFTCRSPLISARATLRPSANMSTSSHIRITTFPIVFAAVGSRDRHPGSNLRLGHQVGHITASFFGLMSSFPICLHPFHLGTLEKKKTEWQCVCIEPNTRGWAETPASDSLKASYVKSWGFGQELSSRVK